MQDKERWMTWAGPAAVVLWVASIVVTASGGAPAETASEADWLAHVESNAASIVAGGWLFMGGCAAFLWFAVALRTRLAAVEGGSEAYSTAAFVGAVLVGALMMLTPGGEIAAAITADEQQISAPAVAALRLAGEAFISAATLAATLMMIGTAVVAFRTGVLPRAWGGLSVALAVVLVIPHVGWAALLLGLPLWTIGMTVLLRRASVAGGGRDLSSVTHVRAPV